MRKVSPHGPAGTSVAARTGGVLQAAAFVIVLGAAVSRCFLAEMPFRISPLRFGQAAADPGRPKVSVDRGEIARATFAAGILVAAACWLVGGALRGRIAVRHAWLAALILVFAALSLVSGLRASEKRDGLLVWMEQVSLLGAGFVMVQCCRDRRRFARTVTVLAGLGLAMGLWGLWQMGEDRAAAFEAYGRQGLLLSGEGPGTAEQEVFEARLRDPALLGFFGLANLFASLLVILLPTAAGLAGDKLRLAVRSLREGRSKRRKGEVDLPTLAAVLAVCAALLIAVVLLLTRSRGGVIAAVLAIVAAAGVVCFRGWLARHRRKVLLCILCLLLAAAGALIASGVRNDHLPGKTMTFRWFYWTGAGQIIADHPLLGVGGGNFGAAYLQRRRAEAEEAVKTPHNFVLHALAQFGIPGGAVYVVVIGGVLLGITRARPIAGATAPGRLPLTPALDTSAACQGPAPRLKGLPGATWLIVLLAGMTFAARAVFFDWMGDFYLLILEIVLPVLALSLSLVVAFWAGRKLSAGTDAVGPLARVGLCCGLAGFALHNLVTFSLWAPAPGLVFWTAAGAALGQAGAARDRTLSRWRWFAAAAGAAGVIAVIVLVWCPIYRKACLTGQLARSLSAGNAGSAISLAEQAAGADPLDAQAAADAARVIVSTVPPFPAAGGRGPAGDLRVVADLQRAWRWADEAVKRNPVHGNSHRLAGGIAWDLAAPGERRYRWYRPAGQPDELEKRCLEELSQDPKNPVLLSRFASLAQFRGDYPEAFRRCEIAAGEDPDSAALQTHLGNTAWLAKRPERARAAWQAAARLAPKNLYADQAVVCTHRAVLLDPRNLRLRVGLARMLLAMGRADPARVQLHAAEEINSALLAFGRHFPPPSAFRFGPEELSELDLLHARAAAIKELSSPGPD